MSFEYDRLELMQAINGAVSKFFFKDLPKSVSAEQLRDRGRAFGAAIGRIQAVIEEEGSIGPETLMEIRRLEGLHSKTFADEVSGAIRPGGEIWRLTQRE
ncbi:hypothetical protein [Pseudomonas sp.]|uniref:hypothetical protein n=1 Tax=Pseudomonas sp. TaxID=306 RepID=UPI003D6F97B3